MKSKEIRHSGHIERVRVPIPATASKGYDALIGPGLIEVLGELLPAHCPAHRYAVITDSNVGPLYSDALVSPLRAEGIPADAFTFSAGEAQKTRATWTRVSDEMLASGFGRDCGVVALGGGVVGDLAGFVAATYMRGVPFVQVPTSLLAMIDASIGGKTGVDTPAGKNLIGAMHQPELVVADTNALGTLPAAHLRAGLAEAVKHGAIADDDYFRWIEASAQTLLNADPAAMAELIRRSVVIKADVVASDEREAGARKSLNFGHTIGHAVETCSGFRLLHGEAVAIGMAVEARLGERIGVTEPGTADRIESLLTNLGLPVSIPSDLAANQILEATRADKKARRGHAEYVFLTGIGAAVWDQAVDEATVGGILNFEF